MGLNSKVLPIKGRVVLIDGETLYRGVADRIEVSNDRGKTWQTFTTFKTSIPEKVLVKSHLASRFFRLGLHHFVATNDGHFYAVFNRKLYKVNKSGAVVSGPDSIHGGRPLCVAVYENKLLYGAYSSNKERKPMSLFSYDGIEHRSVYEFSGIRHIHGVFTDPYTNAVYITTGDYGDEAGIWKLEHERLSKVIGGNQQARAVQLLFDSQNIYYATDTPLEDNNIYRIARSNNTVTCLANVDSSVFYGCQIGAYKFFSTVAEPSKVNTSSYIQLWGSIGDGPWVMLASFDKDILPMKYFQYGQLIFPNIKREGEFLIFYKLGVSGSGRSYIVALDALDEYLKP